MGHSDAIGANLSIKHFRTYLCNILHICRRPTTTLNQSRPHPSVLSIQAQLAPRLTRASHPPILQLSTGTGTGPGHK